MWAHGVGDASSGNEFAQDPREVDAISRVETVDEYLTHSRHMRGSGLLDCCAPLTRDDDARATRVLGHVMALDETTLGHARHLVRDAASFPLQPGGEFGEATLPVGCVGEMNEYLEVRLGETTGLEVARDDYVLTSMNT